MQEELWEYYFALIQRLRRQINDIPYRLDENGVGIDDSPQFDAIKEEAVNLLMHSDYFSPMKPQVRVFSDRIEFENPGAFPLPIAKLFRNMRLADNVSYGFDKVLKWEWETKTKVIFENSIDVALVTFESKGKITGK